MTGRVKPIRTAGQAPADYRGLVYWRVAQYHLMTGRADERIEFLDSRDRQDRLWIDPHKMPGKNIFTSGTVFDENGQVLPEWKEPLKARWTTNRPVRVEYAAGTPFRSCQRAGLRRNPVSGARQAPRLSDRRFPVRRDNRTPIRAVLRAGCTAFGAGIASGSEQSPSF